MIKNDRIINAIAYGDIVEKVIAKQSVGITEARQIVSEMSFSEYRKMEEASADIIPPSGQPLSPQSQPAATAPATIKPGQTAPAVPGHPGQPPQAGAQPGQVVPPVGTPPTGPSVPGQMSQPNQPRVPGQPPQAGAQPGQVVPPVGTPPAGQPALTPQQQQLQRMQQLAGIKEEGSGGASCAGAMGAGTPQPMGSIKRRQPTEETLKTEYTPRSAPKTIAGDVKPNQASGQLSANLAASGIKTASRTNNGMKKR